MTSNSALLALVPSQVTARIGSKSLQFRDCAGVTP
jgi:hypothetical protein